MSFQQLKKEELDTIAEAYGLDEEHRKTKKSIIEELAFQNITYSQWLKESGKEEEDEDVEASDEVETVEEDKGEKYLVKMVRKNPYFQFGNVSFSSDAPFALVDEKTRDALLDEQEGFVLATPKELKEFYG